MADGLVSYWLSMEFACVAIMVVWGMAITRMIKRPEAKAIYSNQSMWKSPVIVALIVSFSPIALIVGVSEDWILVADALILMLGILFQFYWALYQVFLHGYLNSQAKSQPLQVMVDMSPPQPQELPTLEDSSPTQLDHPNPSLQAQFSLEDEED